MPNSHIIFSLNSYIENPDPRYALMLKGKWGCGKTFRCCQRDIGAILEISKNRGVTNGIEG